MKNKKRSIKITAHVNEAEYQKISIKAHQTGKSMSSYLRDLACNYPLRSKVDELAYRELALAKADLGRLGGLFKKWLTGYDKDSKEYKDIDDLLQKIFAAEYELIQVAKKLIK